MTLPLRPSPGSPAERGYRWPAEWEPQSRLWLSWPHNRRTWPGRFEGIPEIMARYVREVAQFQPVDILAGGDDVMREATDAVGGLANVTLHDILTNDAWCRDHGPTFLAGSSSLPPALVDWGYNAWGGKYPPYDLDDAVPQRIAEGMGRIAFTPGVILEGGAIDGNGRGTILTTESCLLNPNRNGPIGKSRLEQLLADFVGARLVIWLTGGDLAGDDTDGHVDQLARFVDPCTVVVAHEPDPADINHQPLARNLKLLRNLTNETGTPLRVVTLEMPRPVLVDGQRLPASYCNFQIGNRFVIVPQFDDPNDAPAITTLRDCFPDRRVIGLPARDLVWGLGAYHCLSQQEAVI
ncbi:MAG: agmatine deiminase family protein [Planctomycetes bacterium]|nr:agmatine deiminase family protein [Planctomycetota bacterium]